MDVKTLEELPKTVVCDIDGCIFKHMGNLPNMILGTPEICPNVKEQFDLWDKKAYKIILLTGRRESMRDVTERQLRSFGLFWDVLVMNATRGQRILVNDIKPGIDGKTAVAHNLERNQGFVELIA
jgi:hydroxymethylpyrimidine pyrophosphatase-like HAD family hydrolase